MLEMYYLPEFGENRSVSEESHFVLHILPPQEQFYVEIFSQLQTEYHQLSHQVQMWTCVMPSGDRGYWVLSLEFRWNLCTLPSYQHQIQAAVPVLQVLLACIYNV